MWFELTTLVVIGTDCTGSNKSNYHDNDHDGAQWITEIHLKIDVFLLMNKTLMYIWKSYSVVPLL